MFHRYLPFVIVVLLTNIILHAQMSTPVVAGKPTPPSLTMEATKRDVLVMGLRVSNDFDNNALSYSQKKQSNLLTVVEPHIGWSLWRSRANWTLDYHPGFSLSHQLSGYDSRSHMLDTTLQLMLTNHLSLRLRESFLQTQNPFDLLPESGSAPGSSVLDRPNPPLATTARARSEQSGVDIYYALDSHTVVAVGGAFFRVGYDSPQQNRVLARAQSASAHAVYSHRLSRRHWIGLEYNIQDLISEQPQSRALVHSVFYADTMQIRPNISLTFFAGPERLSKRDELLLLSERTLGTSHANWQWAGGGVCSFTAAHTTLTVSLSQRMSDGGGFQGIAHVSDAIAELHQKLTQRWKADLLTSYSNTRMLSVTPASLSYFSIASGFTRVLTPRVSLEFRFWRVRQFGPDVGQAAYVADHNRISTSLVYDFRTPLQGQHR